MDCPEQTPNPIVVEAIRENRATPTNRLRFVRVPASKDWIHRLKLQRRVNVMRRRLTAVSEFSWNSDYAMIFVSNCDSNTSSVAKEKSQVSKLIVAGRLAMTGGSTILIVSRLKVSQTQT